MLKLAVYAVLSRPLAATAALGRWADNAELRLYWWASGGQPSRGWTEA